jgi:hypothetical protein
MTLRVARIYFGLADLALLGSFGAAMLLAAQFVVGEGIAVVLIALVGLAWWATGRDRAWGLLLWALTVLLVAVPFLVAGVPHSGSITTTEYGTGRLMTDHYEQPGSRGWLSLGVAHVLLAAVGLVELTARLRRRRPGFGARPRWAPWCWAGSTGSTGARWSRSGC